MSGQRPRLGEFSAVGRRLWRLGWRPGRTYLAGFVVASFLAVGYTSHRVLSALSGTPPAGYAGAAETLFRSPTAVPFLAAAVAFSLSVPLAVGLGAVAAAYEYGRRGAVTGAYRELLDARRRGYAERADGDVEAYTLVGHERDRRYPTAKRRRTGSHVLLGELAVRVVEDVTLDVASRELTFHDDRRDVAYDRVVAVEYEAPYLGLRLADGETVRVRAESRPDELIDAVDDRIGGRPRWRSRRSSPVRASPTGADGREGRGAHSDDGDQGTRPDPDDRVDPGDRRDRALERETESATHD